MQLDGLRNAVSCQERWLPNSAVQLRTSISEQLQVCEVDAVNSLHSKSSVWAQLCSEWAQLCPSVVVAFWQGTLLTVCFNAVSNLSFIVCAG